mmetsp:Transcript_17955/g.33276  ORF Transcript_17955/g.33276 Transcript_17955/m.33276 type:complete len:263 (+) Transcript_17955:6491-7279(+)
MVESLLSTSVTCAMPLPLSYVLGKTSLCNNCTTPCSTFRVRFKSGNCALMTLPTTKPGIFRISSFAHCKTCSTCSSILPCAACSMNNIICLRSANTLCSLLCLSWPINTSSSRSTLLSSAVSSVQHRTAFKNTSDLSDPPSAGPATMATKASVTWLGGDISAPCDVLGSLSAHASSLQGFAISTADSLALALCASRRKESSTCSAGKVQTCSSPELRHKQKLAEMLAVGGPSTPARTSSAVSHPEVMAGRRTGAAAKISSPR